MNIREIVLLESILGMHLGFVTSCNEDKQRISSVDDFGLFQINYFFHPLPKEKHF